MKRSAYEEATKRITDALEQGVVPWRKPWRTVPEPVNAVSKRTYRGINLFLLSISPFTDHRWLTFRQAQGLGGNVKRGAKASLVVFWTQWEAPSIESTEGTATRRTIPILRFYHLFNAEQCEGLSLQAIDEARIGDGDRIARAEELVKTMPSPPRIREGGEAAWYRARDDLVQIPPLPRFETVDAFYATLFHELGHATGHESRLKRPGVAGDLQFGSEGYSREELVAELASAFCCASLGLDNSLFGQSASYVDGWLTALRDDPKALTIAAAHAQRAADYMRGLVEGPNDEVFRCPA